MSFAHGKRARISLKSWRRKLRDERQPLLSSRLQWPRRALLSKKDSKQSRPLKVLKLLSVLKHLSLFLLLHNNSINEEITFFSENHFFFVDERICCCVFLFEMTDREGNRQYARNGRQGFGDGGRARSPRLNPAGHIRQRPAELQAQGERLPARASSASPGLDTRHRGDNSAARAHRQPWGRRNAAGSKSRSPPPERSTPLLSDAAVVPQWLPSDTKEAVTFVDS